MISFRIIWVGSKFSDKQPYKRYTKKRHREGEGHVKTEAGNGAIWPQAIKQATPGATTS